MSTAPQRPPATDAAEVTATAAGSWPGTDAPEAARIFLGELGDPHLPPLAELPDRGPGADPVGRTAALLVDLPVDIQTFGWRLVDRPGAEHRRAVSLLASDINVLADVAGAGEAPPAALKVQVLGPLTLAASLYLHQGERALLDYGARRDLADSLAAGLGVHLAKVAAAVPGARLSVQVDEPDVARVLDGAVPTASGYRTLRALPVEELRRSWALVLDAARAAGAAEIAVNLAGGTAGTPGWRTALAEALAGSADAIAVPLAPLDPGHWELLAGGIEGGKRLWAGVVPAQVPAPGKLRPVSGIVDQVMRPWRAIGLPAAALAGLRVTPDAGLETLSPAQARAVLTRSTDTARALNDVLAGA